VRLLDLQKSRGIYSNDQRHTGPRSLRKVSGEGVKDGKFTYDDLSGFAVYHTTGYGDVLSVRGEPELLEQLNALIPQLREQIIAELKRDGVRVWGKEIGILEDGMIVPEMVWSYCTKRNAYERGDTHTGYVVCREEVEA
jgi:hypothetical protein